MALEHDRTRRLGRYIRGLTTLACLAVIGATGCGGSPTGTDGAEAGPADPEPAALLRDKHLVQLVISEPVGAASTSPATRREAVIRLSAGRRLVVRADALTTVDSVEPDGSRRMSVEALGTVALQGGEGGALGYTYVHRLGPDGSSQIDEFAVDDSQLPAETRQLLPPLLHSVELVLEAHLAGLLVDDAPSSPMTVQLESAPIVGSRRHPALALSAAVAMAERRAEPPFTRTARTLTIRPSETADGATLHAATLRGTIATSGDRRVVERSALAGSGRIVWPGAGTFTVRLTSTVTSAQPAMAGTP